VRKIIHSTVSNDSLGNRVVLGIFTRTDYYLLLQLVGVVSSFPVSGFHALYMIAPLLVLTLLHNHCNLHSSSINVTISTLARVLTVRVVCIVYSTPQHYVVPHEHTKRRMAFPPSQPRSEGADVVEAKGWERKPRLLAIAGYIYIYIFGLAGMCRELEQNSHGPAHTGWWCAP
jgi:hypothetical protein